MDVDRQIYDFKNEHSSHFVEWVPNINSTLVFNNKLRDIDMAAVSIYNHTAIKDLFKRLSVQFTSMFRSRAYLHLYTEQGLDEMDFREA
ncbi:tubulin beta chain, partial [Clarias magur]